MIHQETEQNSVSTAQSVWPPIVLAALTATYLLLWYNRYLGLSANGWFYFYGQQILHGKVPYRDFYLYVPPLHPLKFTLLSALFGDGLLVPRIAAVVERLLVAVGVYYWLLRVFAPGPAFLGSFVGVVAFCSDIADALSLHHHDSVLYAVGAGLLASHALTSRNAAWWMAGSGFFAALCFFAKHTTGAGVSLAIVTLLGCGARGPFRMRHLIRVVLMFGLGWIVPAGCLLGWLGSQGALAGFLDQVFLKGPSSKGPLWMVLLRPFVNLYQYPLYVLLSVAALAILWTCRGGLRRTPASFAFSKWTPILVAICAAFLALGVFLSRAAGMAVWVPGVMLGLVLMLLTLMGTVWVTVSRTIARFRGDFSEEDTQVLLLAAVSTAVAVMLSLSWIAYGPMAMPGLAMIVAMLAQHAIVRIGEVRRFMFLAAAGLAVSFMVAAKLHGPFGWEGWTDGPVAEATAEPAIPELKGFRFPHKTSAFLEQVTRTIDANSEAGEPIFVFPWAPLFYSFADRAPTTFAYVHWFDVTPDYVARQDAAELLAHPPAVIVYFPLSDERVREQERRFRGGARSGQRDLIEAIQRLTSSYRLVDTIKQPFDDRSVQIFAQRK